jgi:acetylornithine deacetylase/succinyl-diaminopimelate desuccinylase-like protein
VDARRPGGLRSRYTIIREVAAMRRRPWPVLVVLLAAVLLLALPAVASAQSGGADVQEFRAMFRELVEIDTTDSKGDTTRAAQAMATRLRAAGFDAADVQVLGPHPRKGNLVARLRGNGTRPPLLLLAHLDVVEAPRDGWSTDPFTLVEKDGYFYGRGTTDDKAMAAIFVDILVRFKREGFTPTRDLIVALTADEELGSRSPHNGVRWLLANHRSLIDAGLVINEGGGGERRGARHLVNRVQTSEKIPVNFQLEVTNAGGHSSRPRKDNAIYQLAEGLTRLARFEFPARLNDATRLYFERTAALQSGARADDMRAVAKDPPDADALARLAADPYHNALLRTTCVATRLEGGHAGNALPQTARAVVNCRLLPEDSPEEVQRMLAQAVGGAPVSVTMTTKAAPSPASPLDSELMGHVERITADMWPGALVIPVMGTGATDSRWLRAVGIPCYGVSGLFDQTGAHGQDERIGVKDLYAGREFLSRLVRALASGK